MYSVLGLHAYRYWAVEAIVGLTAMLGLGSYLTFRLLTINVCNCLAVLLGWLLYIEAETFVIVIGSYKVCYMHVHACN